MCTVGSGHGGCRLVRVWYGGEGEAVQARASPAQRRAAGGAYPHARGLGRRRQRRWRRSCPCRSAPVQRAQGEPAPGSARPLVRDVSAGGVVYRRATVDGPVEVALVGRLRPKRWALAQGHARSWRDARRHCRARSRRGDGLAGAHRAAARSDPVLVRLGRRAPLQDGALLPDADDWRRHGQPRRRIRRRRVVPDRRGAAATVLSERSARRRQGPAGAGREAD